MLWGICCQGAWSSLSCISSCEIAFLSSDSCRPRKWLIKLVYRLWSLKKKLYTSFGIGTSNPLKPWPPHGPPLLSSPLGSSWAPGIPRPGVADQLSQLGLHLLRRIDLNPRSSEKNAKPLMKLYICNTSTLFLRISGNKAAGPESQVERISSTTILPKLVKRSRRLVNVREKTSLHLPYKAPTKRSSKPVYWQNIPRPSAWSGMGLSALGLPSQLASLRS